MDSTSLPIDSIRDRVHDALSSGPVVVTAPTGSGKSTQIPRWCASRGRVLVVEPRRVACRGLASWVARLEGCQLGGRVGYTVRDDNRSSADTRILFATPGVVLRWFAGGHLPSFDTLIIDEFHERSLDVDLILALAVDRFEGALLVMSATMDAGRLSKHLSATTVEGEGRTFPVEVHHLAGDAMLPTARGLEARLAKAVRACGDAKGDILAFLPGKAEIGRALDQFAGEKDLEVLQIHGGLSLGEQSRVFEPGKRRRLILTTNVAETSITVPGIGVVIDSGLVRRTRYVNGRGHLTLVPIAMDSADQRAGRSGRTAAGICYRLWNREAVLERITPPEIFRESLSPLVLAAAACGARADRLPFVDPPKDYAMEAAVSDLEAIDATDEEWTITERGRQLFGLPLDATLGSLLVEAEREGCADEAIDLVSALAVGRQLFSGGRPSDPDQDLRRDGCDGVALIRAVREGKPGPHRLHRHLLSEARAVRGRLRAAWGLPPSTESDRLDRGALVRAALASDPRCAHVARRRKNRVFWGNGTGTEAQLARESAVEEDGTDALAVLQSIALGEGFRKSKIYATCSMPVRLPQLVAAGLGTDRVEHVAMEGRRSVVARIETIFAGKTIGKREEVPVGALAREAIAGLLKRGSLYRENVESTGETLESVALMRRLRQAGLADPDMELGPWEETSKTPDLTEWLDRRLVELGVESGDDLALLDTSDFQAIPLPEATREWMDKRFPQRLSLGDSKYRADYDLQRREVTFTMSSGTRKGPPSLSVLPTYRGFRIRVKHHSKVWVLKESS